MRIRAETKQIESGLMTTVGHSEVNESTNVELFKVHVLTVLYLHLR